VSAQELRVTDRELVEKLQELGIDEKSWRVLALLPLVQVAWADGTIHKKETRIIEAIAAKHGMLTGNGAKILHGWLTESPGMRYLRHGRRALAALTKRRPMIDGVEDDVKTLLGYCERVANAAGGLYNVAFTMDPLEKLAIVEIAEALEVADHGHDWSEVAAL